MIRFPSTAHVGRIMPKEAFYKQLDLSNELKEKFVSDVQRIMIEYSLTADSIHVDASEEPKEILILTVQLKKKEFDRRIVETIARQNKHKLIFLLQYESDLQIALYSGKLYMIAWQPTENAELKLKGNTISAIWEGFVEQVALTDEKPTAEKLTIEERLQRQERIDKLQKEIDKLERMVRKETQPKIKFELYQQKKEMERQMDKLNYGTTEDI